MCRRLADIDKDNALSEMEFCVAMKLVLMRRRGYDIPNVLPESLQPLTVTDQCEFVIIQSY